MIEATNPVTLSEPTLHVHIPPSDLAKHAAALRTLLPPNVHLTAGPEDPQPAGCHILVHGSVKAEWLDASPSLRAVIVPYAGIAPELQTLLLRYPQISLHNLHHNDIATAEFALALLFAAAKFVVPLDRQLRTGDWRQRYHGAPSLLLAGKRVMILGYGAIGRQIAPVCQALGMQVTGVRRHAPAHALEKGVAVHPVTALPALLPTTDILICVLPQTPETVGLIGSGGPGRTTRRRSRRQCRARAGDRRSRALRRAAKRAPGRGRDRRVVHLPARRRGAQPHAPLALSLSRTRQRGAESPSRRLARSRGGAAA